MVFFITSRSGFKEIENHIMSQNFPIWVGKGILSEGEVQEYRNNGMDITEFDEDFNCSDMNHIEEALYTIQEHHPGEKIFVERLILEAK